MYKTSLGLIGTFFSLLTLSHATANAWDGKYNAAFEFRMSAQTVCPKRLPIDIELVVKNGIAKGYIFNNGGGNTHDFCKLYHNGVITGTVKSDGKVLLEVKQNNSHSRQYSSFKINGNIEGRNWIYSRSKQYHPTHTFEFTRVTEKEQISQQVAAVIEIADTAAPAKLTSASTTANPVETESTTYIESNSSNENASSVKQTKRTDSSDSMEMQVKASVVASVGEARLKIDEVESRITMLVAILEYTSNASPTRREKITSTIGSEIEKLRKEKAYMQTFYSKRFSTPIRPNNANLKVSAFRAAETFPKIPYYVPGTDEVGEMLVMPQVSDVGALYYSFEFMDPSSSYSKVRDTIKVSHESIDFLISGLAKIDSWTDVAQDNNVNRRVEKTASCIPVNACDDKKAGVSSTEVMFQIYEDGSTAGRIQRNKGLYVVGYNMSVESSILLEAYLRYMKEIGSKEFNVGVMTNEEILDLFE